MTIVALITLNPTESSHTILPNLQNHLQASHARFIIGTKVSRPTTVQVTTEWPSVQSTSALQSSPAFTALLAFLTEAQYSPTTVTATLSASPFSPTTAPILEWVKTDFPSPLSAEKQKGIEDDFARFETIYRKQGTMEDVGEVSLSHGWSEEHKDGNGEKVKSWLVARGWKDMTCFVKAMESEAFKEGIPILLGWGAPFTLVSICDVAGVILPNVFSGMLRQ